MSISQAEHNFALATAVADANRTKASVGNHACVAVAAALASMRGVRLAAAAGTAIGTSSSAGAAKSATEAKKPKPPVDPLHFVAVNPNFKVDRWGTYKAHYGPIKKFVDKCKTTNPLSSIPYDTSVDSCPSYHNKNMCNGQCGRAENLKPHTVEQDAHLGLWEAT